MLKKTAGLEKRYIPKHVMMEVSWFARKRHDIDSFKSDSNQHYHYDKGHIPLKSAEMSFFLKIKHQQKTPHNKAHWDNMM